jgi:hypothetical protein
MPEEIAMDALSLTVEVGKLEPGAVLAEAVVDRAGAVLLLAGVVLDEAAIAALVRRDVSQVRVRALDAAAILHAQRQALSARLEYLFRHAGDCPAARSLFQGVLAYRLGKNR